MRKLGILSLVVGVALAAVGLVSGFGGTYPPKEFWA